jgi:hypothetical protein
MKIAGSLRDSMVDVAQLVECRALATVQWTVARGIWWFNERLRDASGIARELDR